MTKDGDESLTSYCEQQSWHMHAGKTKREGEKVEHGDSIGDKIRMVCDADVRVNLCATFIVLITQALYCHHTDMTTTVTLTTILHTECLRMLTHPEDLKKTAMPETAL